MASSMLTPALPLAVFGAASSDLDAGGVRRFDSWQAFERSGIEPLGFHVERNGAGATELLWAVRTSAWWSRSVTLAPETGSPLDLALSDGPADLSTARAIASRVISHQNLLALQAQTLDLGERILYFLAARDGALLQPVCDRHARLLYRFPVAEALAGDETRATEAVVDLQRRRLLEGLTPIDRVRHCRKCSSAHPHFYDACPHCRSIHIERGAGLHCFTCGHVGPQEDFERSGALQCPQCSARLRHIGVDYDRPLTQYTCRECHHLFVETGVAVRCLDCGQEASPDELDLRIVAPLRLTTKGRKSLGRLHGVGDDDVAPGRADLSGKVFLRLVSWVRLAGMAGDGPGFNVVHIALKRDADSGFHSQGQADTVNQEVGRRIGEVLEAEEVFALDRWGDIWVLVRQDRSNAMIQRVRSVPLEWQEQPLSLAIRSAVLPAGSGSWELADELAHALGAA